MSEALARFLCWLGILPTHHPYAVESVYRQHQWQLYKDDRTR